MRQLTLLSLLLLTITLTFGQGDEKVRRRGRKEPDFSTAGEQEYYWTKQIFKFDYKPTNYERYKGQIVRVDSTTFQFDSVVVKIVDPRDRRLILMLENGILSPWMRALTIKISEELTELNPSYKVKRFRLSVRMSNIVNPTVYFIELTNKEATLDMGITRFIEGANLTFFKQGWVKI